MDDSLTCGQRIRVEAEDAAIRAVSMPDLKIDGEMTHCDLIKIAREFENYIRVETRPPSNDSGDPDDATQPNRTGA